MCTQPKWQHGECDMQRDVVLLTSGDSAKKVHEMEEEDATINFNSSINGFYVCLSPAKKWSVSWPAQANPAATTDSNTHSSGVLEQNSFRTTNATRLASQFSRKTKKSASPCAPQSSWAMRFTSRCSSTLWIKWPLKTKILTQHPRPNNAHTFSKIQQCEYQRH